MSTITLSPHLTFSTPFPRTHTALATLYSWNKENIDPLSLTIAGLLGSEGGKGKVQAKPKRSPLKEIVLASNETRGRGPGVGFEFLIVDWNDLPTPNPARRTRSSALPSRQTTATDLLHSPLVFKPARGSDTNKDEQKDMNKGVENDESTTSGTDEVGLVADKSIATATKSLVRPNPETEQAETSTPRRANVAASKANDENKNQATMVVETKGRKKKSAGAVLAGKAKRDEGRAVAETMRKMR